MKYKNSYRLLVLILFGMLIYSCQRELNIKTQEDLTLTGQHIPDTIRTTTQLGKKLENPYSVTNMQKALDTILKEIEFVNTLQARSFRNSVQNIDIETTDLYVRFLPKDSIELESLIEDTTLIFYDYPLDYEIENTGEYYHDSTLSETQITWQYTVVKPNYNFPNTIRYEILSELFIPDNDERYHQGDSAVLDKIETVSLYMTDNLSEEEKGQIEKAKQQSSNKRQICIWFICWDEPDDYHPQGRVQIQDTDLGIQPVRAALIKVRRWFKTSWTRTDHWGNFWIHRTYRRPVNYAIKWETYHFSIRNSWWWFTWQAYTRGPHTRSRWDVTLRAHTQDWYLATIYAAAHQYYHEYIKGLKRPPLNAWWKPQMKIHAKYVTNDESHGDHRNWVRLFGIGSPVRIYNYRRRSSAIHATTIHELAHASHWELRKNKWNFGRTSDKVIESWARGVQWELTRMKYTNYRGGPTILPNYTQVVLDMIDNSRDFNNGSENLSQDNVTGYTIKQIEDVLSYTSSWNGWRGNIKNKYNNDTENNLDALFNHWD